MVTTSNNRWFSRAAFDWDRVSAMRSELEQKGHRAGIAAQGTGVLFFLQIHITGGTPAGRLGRRLLVLVPPPAVRRGSPHQSPRRRGAGPGPSGSGRGHRRGRAAPPVVRGGGHGSTD